MIKKIVQSYSQMLQLLVLAVVVVSGFMGPLVYAAGSYKFYASENKITSSYAKINISTYSTSPDTLDVSGTVTYDSSKLHFNSIDINTGEFTLSTSDNGAGKITFSGRSTSSATNGPHKMMTVDFDIKKYYSETETSIKFASNSTINGQNADIVPYTIKLNNPSKKPSESSDPPKTSTPPKPIQTTAPKESTKPTPSPDPTPPASEPDLTGVISNVNVTPSYTSSKIEFTINSKKPSPQFNFSESYTSKYKLLPIEQSSKSTYSVSIPSLIPGHTYYYMIVDGTGDDKASYSDSFLTIGYPINIEVTENGKPVQSAQAQINSQTYPVQNGVLSLGLAAGTYEGTVTSSSASTPIKFTVKDASIPIDGSDPETQRFSVALSSNVLEGGPGATTTIFQFIGVLAGGIALLTVGFLIFMSIRRKKLENNNYSSGQQSSSVVIDDGYKWDQYK